MKKKWSFQISFGILLYCWNYIYFSEALCTFTKTGTNYTGQYMYKCYTCIFDEDEGVCSVCVNTCHDGHDVSNAEYCREFYCDCGARGEESCRSLVGELIKNTIMME